MRWTIFLLTAVLLATPLTLAEKGPKEREDDDERSGRGEAPEHEAKAQRGHQGHFEKGQDKWVLRNDDITIWFHQGDRSKPTLAVFRTGEDGNKSGFRLALDEIAEVGAGARHDDGDDDGDDGEGSAFHRVRGHRINLHPAREWWTSVANHTDEITVTMSHLFNQGNVTLVFHVPTDGGKVKFDVLVRDWRWADVNDTLVLRLRLLERGAEQHGDNASFNGGFVEWATRANVTYPGGSRRSIPVEGLVQNHGDGARILLRFNGTGGYGMLDYDPTIGVQSASAGYVDVPGVGWVAGAGAIAVVALVASRRKP
jgi:hypothetical protein